MFAGGNGEYYRFYYLICLKDFVFDVPHPLRTTILLVRITLFLKRNSTLFLTELFRLEPLRRGDLLNAINKLAGERGAQKHHLLIRRPLAITQTYS
jgi:hypothetical protein